MGYILDYLSRRTDIILLVQELKEKELEPQNVAFSYKTLTKLANTPEMLQSFQREFANPKISFHLQF